MTLSNKTTQPQTGGMDPARLEIIRMASQRLIDQHNVPGLSHIIARDGQVLYQSVQGQRGIDDPRPLTDDALYRIYSLSKPVTSLALMQLYEQGYFQLTDPVTDILPEIKHLEVLTADGHREPDKSPITFQQLLTNTAGFSYGFDQQDPLDQLYKSQDLFAAANLDDFVTRLATLPLKFHPGCQRHYSGNRYRGYPVSTCWNC